MDKKLFLLALKGELQQADCKETEKLLGEYGGYFDYKRNEGYSDDDVIRMLRAPEDIAQPLRYTRRGEVSGTGQLLVWMALCLAGLFVALFFVFMALLGVSLGFGALALIYTGALYLAGANPLMMLKHISIEFREYWSGALMGLGLMALAVILLVLVVRYAFLWKALFKSYMRFNKNALSYAAGKPLYPPRPIDPGMSLKLERRLNLALSFALIIFCLCFTLGFLSAAITAGDIAFWRVWNWG